LTYGINQYYDQDGQITIGRLSLFVGIVVLSGYTFMAIGQFFSQRFGYAVHALAYVAKKPAGELATLPELANWMRTIWPNASESYLSNVVQRLARGRLLRSHRGIAGGYSLGRAAADISLRDLVELLEGVDHNRCSLSLEDDCPVKSRCSIQRKLRNLEADYLRSLENVTVEELSKDIVATMPKKVRS
jgi:Rrf2 family protein